MEKILKIREYDKKLFIFMQILHFVVVLHNLYTFLETFGMCT